jgi:membrane protein insertase Oxa1/YidC/SpoIIIJ
MHHINIALITIAASAILTPVCFWALTEQQNTKAQQELQAMEQKYEAIGISLR